ncbi:hypothetical protein H4219_001810 [Mycoemilia scoparia]|uniref:Uncharacterized protein n=1 Tax=Mycoemilia scoparia TaxID=417184 RepID=A0A9W8A2M2_9FUNG|nr:hypothetical protein H4219_001810 [Mycoemilia scoparia]
MSDSNHPLHNIQLAAEKFKELVAKDKLAAHREMVGTLGKPDHISLTHPQDSTASAALGSSKQQSDPPTFMPGIAMSSSGAADPKVVRSDADQVKTTVIAPQDTQSSYYAVYKDPANPARKLWFEVATTNSGKDEHVKDVGLLQ